MFVLIPHDIHCLYCIYFHMGSLFLCSNCLESNIKLINKDICICSTRWNIGMLCLFCSCFYLCVRHYLQLQVFNNAKTIICLAVFEMISCSIDSFLSINYIRHLHEGKKGTHKSNLHNQYYPRASLHYVLYLNNNELKL